MIDHPETDRAQPARTDAPPAEPGVCPLAVDRRTFVRHAALAAVASLAAAGAAPAAALAERVGTLTPGRAQGATRSYPIPATDGVAIDAENQVILARWQGRVYAFSLRCPHRGQRLEWHRDETRIFCPKHKARFHPDGAHASGRSTRPLDRYALSRRGETIVVDFGTLFRADEDPAGWAAAVVTLG
ncbi:MAG: Rieske (2Fe-2S) protein [Gemmatimonadetes bacterium]|nr:Rieske (2Fe-2S) protein [Gemmatimonadota bacterium]